MKCLVINIMLTFKILIFSILSGVLGFADIVPTSEKNLLKNEQTKEKRSIQSIISPDGELYNERNVLYNDDDSPYGDGFYGFELFRQLFEKSGTILGPLSKLFETFSYDKVRNDLMLLRRFLNIIIRLATLFNTFLPAPEVSNTAMENFSKLHPGTKITTTKDEENYKGLPDISDIPEKPENIYDYVTRTPNNEHQQKELNEETIIKELSKIDLQRINSPNKRHQGKSNNNKKETENRIYFPSTSLPNHAEKPNDPSISLEEFIKDRNRVKRPNNVPPGSAEVLKPHPKIDLRSHHIYEADLTVLSNKGSKNNT